MKTSLLTFIIRLLYVNYIVIIVTYIIILIWYAYMHLQSWFLSSSIVYRKKDKAQQDDTVKNILFIQSGAALLKLCFSSYGKETVINTCISPRALGVFSQRSGAALRA